MPELRHQTPRGALGLFDDDRTTNHRGSLSHHCMSACEAPARQDFHGGEKAAIKRFMRALSWEEMSRALGSKLWG